MFEDWTPREIAAMHRATAWLRAMSSLKKDLKKQEKIPPLPLSAFCEDESVKITYSKNKQHDNADSRPL